MKLPLRVLVTGAGSGVGQGILKSLRSCSLPLRLIASDITPFAAGLYVADEATIIPRVEEDGVFDKMIGVLRQCRADVIMVGSEFDLPFFSSYREAIEHETGAIVIVSPKSTVTIAQDKWLTVNFLRDNDFPYPKSVLPTSVNDAVDTATQWGYPVILKPRVGTSSRHVHLVNNEDEIRFFFPLIPNPMLQKMIALPSQRLENEYTCSMFQTASGQLLGPFTARRTLRAGSSWMIEVQPFSELRDLLLKLGEKLPSMGTLNVQLMVGPEGPMPFEFNARFSGTTAIRAHFGFNEPEMAIRNYVLGEAISQPSIRSGVVFRYLEEVFVDGIAPADLTLEAMGTVRSWFRH